MTLYWWMHWFWITTLKLQVLVSLFPWGLLVHGASLPLVPLVQNGHQNGPYFNELSTDHLLSVPSSQPSTNFEQTAHYSTEGLTSPQPTFQVLASDHEQTGSPSDHESATEDQKEATLNDNVGNGYKNVSPKNAAIPSLETPTTSTIGSFPLPGTNDNDDSTYILPHNGPLIEGSRSKGSGDSKIIWIDKLPPKVLGIHDKRTNMELPNENVRKDTIFEEVPMSDGPYNPTGSFINSTNIRVKAVLSTSKTPELTTARDSQYISTDEKTEEEREEKSLNNITTTARTAVYVTDHSDNSMGHAKENLNNSNISVDSTENILEDDYNSTELTTLAIVDNTTSVAKTDIISPEILHKNKSQQENSISVITFDHSNIEESTKVSSGVVQSVIDGSVESRGKTLNAVAVTGIVLGIVVGVGLIGAASCVLYRRRYLNNPQTLNDKCSNPDSSGYIDDSTLRENSEEMYSLDNDSFLNSLEAMTIQNYWTDNVKHTKL